MRNLPNADSWQHFVKRLMRLWRVGILGLIALLSLTLSGCPTLPEINCGARDALLTEYATRYHQCLEDKGNLRHQLKACEERR